MQEVKENNRVRNKSKSKTGQLFNFERDSYLERTSRPIYAIFFLLPFLIFYDMCPYFLDSNILNQLEIRVAAIVWLQELLQLIGVDDKSVGLTPPLVIVVILIAMQITSSKQWRFRVGDIFSMTFECILLAVPLIVMTLLLYSSFGPQNSSGQFDDYSIRNQGRLPPNNASTTDNGLLPLTRETERNNSSGLLLEHIVVGVGIGIHEEFVFRLVLMCILMILFQDVLRLTNKESILLSVIISTLLFSVHHYIDFFIKKPEILEPFNLIRFTLRTIIGFYFAVLYALRGFGITAGTHIYYNTILILMGFETLIIPSMC